MFDYHKTCQKRYALSEKQISQMWCSVKESKDAIQVGFVSSDHGLVLAINSKLLWRYRRKVWGTKMPSTLVRGTDWKLWWPTWLEATPLKWPILGWLKIRLTGF